METMEIILNRVCDELKECAEKLKKGDKMSAGDLEMIGKLIDIKKNIFKTWKLEDEEGGGYSQAGDWEGMARGHFGDQYARDDGYNEGGNSYANRGEHWVRGHYSHANRRRDMRGRYSGVDGMMEHIDMMLDETDDPREKEVIRRFKKELERM